MFAANYSVGRENGWVHLEGLVFVLGQDDVVRAQVRQELDRRGALVEAVRATERRATVVYRYKWDHMEITSYL